MRPTNPGTTAALDELFQRRRIVHPWLEAHEARQKPPPEDDLAGLRTLTRALLARRPDLGTTIGAPPAAPAAPGGQGDLLEVG